MVYEYIGAYVQKWEWAYVKTVTFDVFNLLRYYLICLSSHIRYILVNNTEEGSGMEMKLTNCDMDVEGAQKKNF